MNPTGSGNRAVRASRSPTSGLSAEPSLEAPVRVNEIDDPLPLDLVLLGGFEYACRPDCGLCCYAEPRIEREERPPLLQIAPLAQFGSRRGGSFLRARPDGGACQFLDANRCRVWSARPSPCRQFPVTVHVGERLQASLVLSCPGIDLSPLAEARPWTFRARPRGLEAEVEAAKRRATSSIRRTVDAARRRRRRVKSALEKTGQWVDEEEVRADLRSAIPLPVVEDFPVPDPPPVNEDLANLPLYFDHRKGPVALAGGLGAWELLELRAEGGAEPLTLVPPPARPPELTAEGHGLLEGYLRYFLERDALFGTVVPEIEPGSLSTVTDEMRKELRAIGALVLSRADVRRRGVRDAVGPLTWVDVADGIRACDQDLLDRPTWGDRL